ncbi:MAG: ABC transporter substrate-binding protein [Betaproteobacteria bacterium]|nr:ABC transporter substrate-binding protein [Betaproteobacteria bacterium]
MSMTSLAHADCPRIVSQSPYITRALEWMGRSDCIVGISRYDKLDLPRTGGIIDPDADVIALLDPQVMITSRWTAAAKWQAMAPAGATVLRVDGFKGTDDMERTLRQIGRAAGVADIDARVDRFAAEWRAAAAKVNGGNRRAVIMTACSGAPYSFGRGTTLYELFSSAGLQIVADHDGIRNFRPDGPVDELPRWLDSIRPEIIFALKNSLDEACNVALVRPNTMIVPLDGEYFNHPGPGLLKGLEQLRQVLVP